MPLIMIKDATTGFPLEAESHQPSPFVLLLVSWAATIAIKLAAVYMAHILRTINPLGPPLYPGVWIGGLLIQLVATTAVLLKKDRFLRILTIFLIGYWGCALVSIATSLFFASSTIISGAK